MPMPFRDKTGKVFGFWTVMSFAGRDKSNRTQWNCKCICGTERIVVIGSLTNGKSKSCGCMQRKVTAEKNTVHGMAGSRTYKSWHAMMQRCEGKGGHQSYPDRGIGLCDEWKKFENFFADMGLRPAGKTLDRIDNTKGYSPSNCQWASAKDQANNKHNTVYVTVNSEILCLSDACEKYGIGVSCARHRLRKGMKHQEVFTTPSKKSVSNKEKSKE
jgi:hypothetical protein